MLTIRNVNVYGIDESIRGAKFPMSVDVDKLTTELTPGIKALAQSTAGEGHDNWLNGVVVQFDLKASNKFWVEMERYHHIDFISSQSTMHRIAKFDLDKAYNEYVDPRMVEIMKQKLEEFLNWQLISEIEFLICLWKSRQNPCQIQLLQYSANPVLPWKSLTN